EKPELPPEARDSENPYGFVGRDSALLQLERALRRPPAGILIHGLAGVGKTTLARGLMQWLRDTDGLGEGCFWFTFNDIRSSEYVFNQLVAALFGTDVMAADMAQKQAMLVDVFKKHRFILVWDNFESATGVPGTALTAGLPEPDRQRLRGFLGKLRGGASKVIITSRSPEAWLGADRCFALSLGGLQGEERWEYCATILRDLGLDADQKDAGLKNLMDVLGGHPLAMRALLPRLSEVGASVLAEQLKGRIQVEPGSDSLQARLFAALEFVEEALPTALQPLLLPLGLHERFVDANLLEFMAQRADSRFSRADIERLLAMLAVSGLLCPLGRVIHEMHPALTGFLRARPVVGLDDNQREAWRRAFVGVMGRLADHLAPKELHEQRWPFHCHGVNFHTALAEAEALGMDDHFAALTQALGVYARERWDFASAKQRFAVLAEHFKQHSNVEGEAVAYHQLGIIAEERWDFAAAEQWYWKALAIVEKQGDEHRAAITYHQLGMIAKKRRDFAAAEQWYRKSLAIEEKYGNEHGAAITYHALGNLAEDRREFAAAERWYQKALAITEKHGNEHGAAITYHQLGRIAQERQEFTTAEQWYRKALAIWEKQGDEHRAADTYGQLGILAQERREFVMAEHWYRKVLAIVEKQGDEYRAAITYHKLGMIAQERWEFAASAQWYRKSLTIKEKQGDEHGAASTYGELGILAGLQNHFLESGHWLIRCIMAFANQHDSQGAERNAHNFLIFYRQAPLDDQAQLRQIWEEAKLGTFPEDGNPP
ncbi:MAG: tetratricopeptide repeat protein, partial [Candidatus Competibacter sp.]|nr:tetratricopeptide repeat protein [Candidatus Competibacter sp.]